MANIKAWRETIIGEGRLKVIYRQRNPMEAAVVEIGLQCGLSLFLTESELEFVNQEVNNARAHTRAREAINGSHPK